MAESIILSYPIYTCGRLEDEDLLPLKARYLSSMPMNAVPGANPIGLQDIMDPACRKEITACYTAEAVI